MKRTFQEASLRGTNKYILKGLNSLIGCRFAGVSKDLSTDKEKSLMKGILHSMELLVSEFDQSTSELGFNVIRYDVNIIENGVPHKFAALSSSEYRKFKKAEREGKYKVVILNRYKL